MKRKRREEKRGGGGRLKNTSVVLISKHITWRILIYVLIFT